MSLREEQCDKVCRILDDVLANRPTERDSLIVATRSAFNALSEPHWIPVTERLPSIDDYDETFIVTIQCEHVDGWDDYVTGTADWTPHGWDIQSYYLGQIKVVAWMPLPEPFKGVTE